jgi:hypothetical protein
MVYRCDHAVTNAVGNVFASLPNFSIAAANLFIKGLIRMDPPSCLLEKTAKMATWNR